MSQTPPTVTDELSARLLEQLGAPALVEQGFAAACELAPLAEPIDDVRSAA